MSSENNNNNASPSESQEGIFDLFREEIDEDNLQKIMEEDHLDDMDFQNMQIQNLINEMREEIPEHMEEEKEEQKIEKLKEAQEIMKDMKEEIQKPKNQKKLKQVFGGEQQKKTWKGRHFQLTLNDPDMQYKPVKDYLLGLKNTNYFISCLEKAPSTGHKHIHIYVQFEKASNIAASKLHGAHVEVCRGSPNQNVEYIKKENDPEKRGRSSTNGGIKTRRKPDNPGSKSNEQRGKRPAPRSDVQYSGKSQRGRNQDLQCKIRPQTGDRLLHLGSQWHRENEPRLQINRDMGEKHEGFGDFNMVKYENNFWAEVTEINKTAVYDDFRDGDMRPREFINFIDYNIHSMNIKGGPSKTDMN